MISLMWLFAAGAVLYMDFKSGRCGCNAERKPFLYRNHSLERYMWAWSVFAALGLVISFVGRDTFGVLLNSFSSALFVTTLYYHRKQNKKKMLSKILGMVKINDHGRLVVTQQ